MTTRRTIAILFHEALRGRSFNYVINHYADIWRAEGHAVIYLFGANEFVPADLIIVHVDLSVVPEEYLALARQYPLALNGQVRDIRKSTYSQLLVRTGERYDGPVIVKSDLNYAGVPERILGALPAPRDSPTPVFRSPMDYQVYDHIQTVPPALLAAPDIVVEKFVPEMDGPLYCVRSLQFFGDRLTCVRLASPHPIVNYSTQVRVERVDPDPAIVTLRQAMHFDHGKFDYVVHDGQPLLLDANKTTGSGTVQATPGILASRRYRAAGIYSYFAHLS